MALRIAKEFLLIPITHPVRKKMYVQPHPAYPVPVILDDREKFAESTVREVFDFMRKHVKEEMKPERFKPVDQFIQLNTAATLQGFMAPYNWIGGQWWQFGSIQVPMKIGPKPPLGKRDDRVTACDYHYLVARHCVCFTTDVHASMVDHVKHVKTFTQLQIVGPMVKCEVLAPIPSVLNWLTVRQVSSEDVPIA